MSEITEGHWKKYFDFKYLGSHDLLEMTNGKDLVVKITSFYKEKAKDLKGADSEVKVARLQLVDGTNIKPMIVNKTNFRALIKAYKSEDIKDFIGKYVSIWIKPNVMNGESGLRFREVAPNPNATLKPISPSEYEAAAKRYLAENNLDYVKKSRTISAEQETAIIELAKTLKVE